MAVASRQVPIMIPFSICFMLFTSLNRGQSCGADCSTCTDATSCNGDFNCFFVADANSCQIKGTCAADCSECTTVSDCENIGAGGVGLCFYVASLKSCFGTTCNTDCTNCFDGCAQSTAPPNGCVQSGEACLPAPTNEPTMSPTIRSTTGAPSNEPTTSPITITSTSTSTTTTAPKPTNTPLVDSGECKYWASDRIASFGKAAGAPLDVCFGAFSGLELTSTSYIYKCSADKKTVEYWSYTGSSDCNAAKATIVNKLPFVFDASLYPNNDKFSCDGSPCPYFIIEDATAHPTQTCPFDLGKNYLKGEDDYATWHTKLFLQGCMSFGGLSYDLKCSDTAGLSFYNYNNGNCNTNGIGGTAQLFQDGVIECNYGTGRSVYCFDDITSSPTEMPTTTSTTPVPSAGFV